MDCAHRHVLEPGLAMSEWQEIRNLTEIKMLYMRSISKDLNLPGIFKSICTLGNSSKNGGIAEGEQPTLMQELGLSFAVSGPRGPGKGDVWHLVQAVGRESQVGHLPALPWLN